MIEFVCLNLVKMLAKAGQDVTVAAPVDSVLPNGVRLIKTVGLPQQQDRDDLIERMIDINVEDRNGRLFDVIHDYTHRNVFKDADNAIHHCYDPISTRFDFKSKKNMVCFSDWQRLRFERAYSQKAITMPVNIIDTDVFRPDPNAKRERFLFLGKMTPNKGAHRALQYCQELGYPIDIAGGLIPSDGMEYANAVQAAVSRAKDATFRFNVTEEEKLKLMQNAKALIYPQSLDDPQWYAGMEAWSVATPTVSFEHGGLLEDNPNPAFVVRGETAFKDRMVSIDRFDMGAAVRFIQERFSMQAALSRWLDLYREVANGRTWA